jgi:hypothetical protein
VLLACSVICSNTLPSLRMSLAPVGEGQEVTVRPYEGASLYASGSYSGRAIGTFQIDQPGRFLLQTAGEPEAVPAHVAVGQEIGGSLALRAMPIVLLLLFGGMVLPCTRSTLAPQTHGPPTIPSSWVRKVQQATRSGADLSAGCQQRYHTWPHVAARRLVPLPP